MIEICAIASGSNGNCYYIGNETEAVLVDAGISGKEILSRLKTKNLNHLKIKAVFVSHEHTDHIRGVRGISQKLHVPIYLTSKTYFGAYKNVRPSNPRFFNPGDIVEIGGFKIHAFTKNHDAAEPCSFRIEHGEHSIGVLTDIGEACSNVVETVSKSSALFLESNYDEKMLWDGGYPWFLKKRVASEVGHLSNDQAFELLDQHTNGQLQCVFLSHISKENNTHEIALERMAGLKTRFEVKIASRYAPSDVFVLS